MTANRALLAGGAVVVMWASAFPAIQVAVPQVGVIGLSVTRLGIATAALLLVTAVRPVPLPRIADLGWILGCGFFGMFTYQLLLNAGELAVPAGTASIIVSAAPLVSVAVARVLFDDKITLGTTIGSAVAMGGVVVVCISRAGVSVSHAVWIVVGAMIVQGIYHPLQRPLLRSYSGFEVATFTMIAGTVMTLPLTPFGWDQMTQSSISGWLAAAYLGLLPSALGFVAWGYAVARLPVAVSTSLLYLVPPVAVGIAWVWLGQAPIASELVGGLIVLAGVAIVSWRRVPAKPASGHAASPNEVDDSRACPTRVESTNRGAARCDT